MHGKKIILSCVSLEKSSRISAYWADEELTEKDILSQTPVDCAFKPKNQRNLVGEMFARGYYYALAF